MCFLQGVSWSQDYNIRPYNSQSVAIPSFLPSSVPPCLSFFLSFLLPSFLSFFYLFTEELDDLSSRISHSLGLADCFLKVHIKYQPLFFKMSALFLKSLLCQMSVTDCLVMVSVSSSLSWLFWFLTWIPCIVQSVEAKESPFLVHLKERVTLLSLCYSSTLRYVWLFISCFIP